MQSFSPSEAMSATGSLAVCPLAGGRWLIAAALPVAHKSLGNLA